MTPDDIPDLIMDYSKERWNQGSSMASGVDDVARHVRDALEGQLWIEVPDGQSYVMYDPATEAVDIRMPYQRTIALDNRLMPELAVMDAILALLDEIDPDAIPRVLDWVVDHAVPKPTDQTP